MDKELIQIEKNELVETIGQLMAEYTVDEYRDYTGSVQSAIHSIIDDSIEKHIQRIGDEILCKYQLGYYKDNTK
tara:strand:+ start:288 stop:509 length:222 start_codon:yes stop_codon:yes gene_type:complete